MSDRFTVWISIPRSSSDFPRLGGDVAWGRGSWQEMDPVYCDAAPADRLGWKQALASCDAVITSWSTPSITGEMLEGNDRLRLIAHAAGSVADLVDAAVFSRGIQVISANDIMARSVAEWCLAMSLLGHSRLNEVMTGGYSGNSMRWERRWEFRSMRQARIGVWGFGEVARRYVELVRPMEPASILICPDYECSGDLARLGVARGSLEEVFSTCDIIVLAAGLSPGNLGGIDSRLLGLIQDGCLLINCGRAKLVDEDALVALAISGRVRLALDVFHQEPLPSGHPLVGLANVMATPHVAGLGLVSTFIPTLLDRIADYRRGQPLVGRVEAGRISFMTSHRLART